MLSKVKMPRRGAPAVGIGKSVFQVLQLGQPANDIPRKGGLGSEFYEVGEVAAVTKSNGAVQICQVKELLPEFITVRLSGQVERQIPTALVREVISKLTGPFCLDKTRIGRRLNGVKCRFKPSNAFEQVFCPLELGESCEEEKTLDQLSIEYFFEHELVSVTIEGQRRVGQIHEFRPGERSVVISLQEEDLKVFNLEFCSRRVRKFSAVSLFYNAGRGNSASFPNILLGSTHFKHLEIGSDTGILQRANGFKNEQFYRGEIVSAKIAGKRRVALIMEISSTAIAVEIDRRQRETITAENVSKIAGTYYVVDATDQIIPLVVECDSASVKIGRIDAHPVTFEEDCANLPLVPGFLGLIDEGQLIVINGNSGPGSRKVAIIHRRENHDIVWRRTEEEGRTVEGTIVDARDPVGRFWQCSMIPYLWKAPRELRTGYGLMGRDMQHSGTVIRDSQRNPDRISAGFMRRKDISDDTYLTKIFGQVSSEDGGFTKDRLCEVLRDRLKIPVSTIDVQNFIANVLVDQDSGSNATSNTLIRPNSTITEEDFRIAARWRWPCEAWADSLPLTNMLADALPLQHEVRGGLEALAGMTDVQLSDVADAFCDELKKVLRDRVALLRKAQEALLHKISNAVAAKKETAAGHEHARFSAKFQHVVVSKAKGSQMKCGSISDFHKGLEDRIGSSHVKFEDMMKMEHCSRLGCDYKFATANHPRETTPSRQWTLVVGKDGTKVTPMSEETENQRHIPEIENLKKLESALRADLQRAEIIAIVLYTGPMFFVYNAILRESPPEVYHKFKEWNNVFTCTILVLVSAVQKLAQVTKLNTGLRLYRGMSEKTFPLTFYKSDEYGCKGYTEFSFMSATADKAVALQYSGVDNGKVFPVILEIRVGSVDRGACIMEFSQYPEEREYLYVPCSFVEQDSQHYFVVAAGGPVTVLPVRINVNLKTRTVEQLEGQKKIMHLASFLYLISEVEESLVAVDQKAKQRFKEDKFRGEHTVESFRKKIVEQCYEIHNKHCALDNQKYIDDKFYRKIVLEMMDTRMMALSKLEEWLENKKGSSLQYRFETELKTAHRRRISYLSKQLESIGQEEDKKRAALDLCKVKGLITDSIDERNQLDETQLMSSSAEGRSPSELELLVTAGADVEAFRGKDGVRPLWLASQFGHLECIKMLLKLHANINQACNQGATPISMAAQCGYEECVKCLAQEKADIMQADKKGLTPMHQAAINGHLAVIEALIDLKGDVNARDLQMKTPLKHAREHENDACFEVLQCKEEEISRSSGIQNVPSLEMRRLIVSTGDLSDIDGFFALAEYMKTGADVLFIMNYPAYLDITLEDKSFATRNPGLGYRYPASVVMDGPAKLEDKDSAKPEDKDALIAYTNMLNAYRHRLDENSTDKDRANANNVDVMKQALTDIAFHVVKRLHDQSSCCGKVMFCIGGTNTINPFASPKIKNDVYQYSRLVSIADSLSSKEGQWLVAPREGECYDVADGKSYPLALTEYSDIFIDFNGSMAYFSPTWQARLSEAADQGKLKAVFVMGGVRAEEAPNTLPAVQGILNRFSSATMNQLYHPQHTAAFFDFIKTRDIRTFIVTNNTVQDLGKLDERPDCIETVKLFFESNELRQPFLKELAEMHYLGPDKPARKPYDYYVAVAIREYIRQPGHITSTSKTLFYSSEYGISLVSKQSQWLEASKCYVNNFDIGMKDDDTPFEKSKKDAFRNEITQMQNLCYLPSISVQELSFRALQKGSLKVEFAV